MTSRKSPSRQTTSDGSHTLYSGKYNATYHSVHGAIQESMHVFISAGLDHHARAKAGPIHIFEMGFGTGLNALLAWIWAEKNNREVTYTGLELHPLSAIDTDQLNYPDLLGFPKEKWKKLHDNNSGEWVDLDEKFKVIVYHNDLFDLSTDTTFDVIFYDAFGPASQPELWEEKALRIIVERMAPGAVFTTYSAKGDVRRTLQSLGLKMERLPGPPGKREMLRGTLGL